MGLDMADEIMGKEFERVFGMTDVLMINKAYKEAGVKEEDMPFFYWFEIGEVVGTDLK